MAHLYKFNQDQQKKKGKIRTIKTLDRRLIKYKMGLSWAKLKFSPVRAVDEATLIFNSVEVEIEDIVELSLLVLVAGRVVEKKTKLMLYSTQL